MKPILKPLMLLALVAVATACSPKLRNLSPELFSVTPNPPEVAGSNVPYRIAITIPEKWMHRDVMLRITPTLRYGSGEIWGTSTALQGEAVRDNFAVIPYKSGGTHTFTGKFLYDKRAENADLYITFKASANGKPLSLKPVKLTSGILTTATLAGIETTPPAFAPDRFQRIVSERIDQDIRFLIESSEIRASEKDKPELLAWKKRVEEAKAAPNQSVSVEISSYASPEGGVELNEKLSKRREQSTTRFIEKDLGQGKGTLPISANYTAQDWEGFRSYVEASDLPDKELILRVLSMYSDPEEREREIRNVSVVYDRIAREILPQLRRSRITAVIEITGKSDEELYTLLHKAPEQLNVEELLYAVSLERTDEARQKGYQTAQRLYPEDARSANNLVAMAIQKGQFAQAKQLLDAASDAKPIDELYLNRALLLIEEGNLGEAALLVDKAKPSVAKSEVEGLLQLKQGKHTEAAATLAQSSSVTAAVAALVTGNYGRAIDLLDNASPATALTHYLKAVTFARQHNADKAAAALSEAVMLNPSLRAKARKDAEFIPIRQAAPIVRILGK